MTVPLDATRLVSALNEHGVEFVVIGGYAAIGHGVVRTTKDLDIVPDPRRGNLQRLAAAMRALSAVQIGVGDFEDDEMPFDVTSPDDLAAGGNFLVGTDEGRLDIMQWVPGLAEERAYATLAGDALSTHVEGHPVRICSLAHLRLMKRAAGRPQDLQDLADLAAAHGDDA
ncbi:MAG: hypothetical protein H0T43_09215 [Solirubrobacterales bacterium]|nr:hypothetical protein [Solirubrobacterales bacterium]